MSICATSTLIQMKCYSIAFEYFKWQKYCTLDLSSVCMVPRLSNRLHQTAICWETSIKINLGQKHFCNIQTKCSKPRQHSHSHAVNHQRANIQLSHVNHLKRWLLLFFNWVLIIYMYRKSIELCSNFHDQINKFN